MTWDDSHGLETKSQNETAHRTGHFTKPVNTFKIHENAKLIIYHIQRAPYLSKDMLKKSLSVFGSETMDKSIPFGDIS